MKYFKEVKIVVYTKSFSGVQQSFSGESKPEENVIQPEY